MRKQQELYDEYNRLRLNEEAVNIERVYFYKTDKRVDPKQEEPFWFAAGNIPILVSAPHAVRHYRQKKIKPSDEYTGSIVCLLNRLTGCYALATTKLYGGDPNADESCIYKEKLAQICRQNRIRLILDIHGAARDREFDVDFGTNGGKNLLGKKEIIDVLVSSFKSAGFARLTENRNFSASTPNTIANYAARQLGIPAVQLEINRQYRVPHQNAQSYNRLLAALVLGIGLLQERISG